MARLSWFVPRNIRRIPPLKVALIMRVFFVASDNGEAWTGHQAQQDKFSALLDEYGLKNGRRLRDGKSGGSRTYRSQLALLGLIFEKNSNGFLYPTQSGLDMLDATVIVKTLQYQLLKLQYPSTYSLNPKEPIDRKFNIRPFVFLLRLAADPDIDGLSDSDICIPIIFGENIQSYDKCKRLILESRLNGLKSVIPDDEALKQITKKAQTHIDRLKILKRDIANTFSNYLDSTGLAVRKYVDSASRIFLHSYILELLNEVDSAPLIKFVGQRDNQADIQFGNRHGAFKDTRRDFKPRLPVLHSKSEFIRNRFLSEVGLPTTQTKIRDFVDALAKEFMVPRNDISDALALILSNHDYCSGVRLLELSKGGDETDLEFEKAVTRVFELDFGYGKAKWTGAVKGEDHKRYMDVFVVETGRNKCGIIDTKSMSRGAYNLPLDHRLKAPGYIDGARDFYGSRILDLSFVCYVSHQIATGAERQALKVYEMKSIPVSLVSAYGLNWMRENSQFQKNSMAVTDYLSKDPVNLIV